MNLIEETFENVLSFFFDTQREKEQKKAQKEFRKRFEACVNGQIPYESMCPDEKIACELQLDVDERDPKRIIDLLFARQNSPSEFLLIGERFHSPYASREVSWLLNSCILKPAYGLALRFVLNNWNGLDLEFIRKYVELIVRGEWIGKFVEKAEEIGNLRIVRAVAELFISNSGVDYRIKKGLKNKVKEVNRRLRQAEIEKVREEKERHRCELEDRFASFQKTQGLLGGYEEVSTGDDYERFVMFCVKEAGCLCKKVGGTGDYGADLIADVNGKDLIIQCKFYSMAVGYDAVQQVYAAKSIYKGTWCCVVSNADFTRQAIVGGRKLGVKLLSHVDIAEYLKSLKERC